jgi:hypothetical protein
MKIHVLLVAGFVFAIAAPVQAEELSPWFGSEGTDAFQVVAAEPSLLAQADSPNVATEMSCELPDCPLEAKLAKETSEAAAP